MDLFFAPPPSHQLDGVSVDMGKEERHFYSGAQGACYYICLEETQAWACVADCGVEVRVNIIALDDTGAVVLEVHGEGGVRWGVVVDKLRHLEMKGRHRTCLGVACASIFNQFLFNAVFLDSEENTDKF